MILHAPKDLTGNPACEEDLNPLLIPEVEQWCAAYSRICDEHPPLTRACIGLYQIGQALEWEDSSVNKAECTCAGILHILIALHLVGGSVYQLFPKTFEEARISAYSSITIYKERLRHVTKVIQMFFYYDHAAEGSYRKKRSNTLRTEKACFDIITDLITMTPAKGFEEGFCNATQILLTKAYRE